MPDKAAKTKEGGKGKKRKQITSTKSAAKTKEGLSLVQEKFCQLYTSVDREMFGNGTQCYIEAYDVNLSRPNAYEAARVRASQLLTVVNIIDRINSLLETGGFSEQNVDKQHLFLINQHADLKTKLGAIQEYNKLKARIQKKIDITSGGKSIEGNTIVLADFKDAADSK